MIKALPSENDSTPGIGFPKWQVDLMKVRNGKPGSWQVGWCDGKFELLKRPTIHYQEEQRKVV
jgi:protein ImuA